MIAVFRRLVYVIFLLPGLWCTSAPALKEVQKPASVVFNSDDLVLWIFSDIQPRNKNDRRFFEIAADDIAKMKNIDAAICAGDIVHWGTGYRVEESYNWFYKVYKSTGIRDLYEIAGNHDARNIGAYLKATGKPLHYALQYGNLIIILLSDESDSSATDISDGAFLWWKNLVESNRDKNIITVTHSHLGGSGFLYNIVSYRNVRGSERFTDVLAKEKVELWLFGHTHMPSSFGLSKRQIGSLNDTVFMNVSAIQEDYLFSSTESRIITLKQGSDKMTVKIRDHRDAGFKSLLEQTIKLKTKFKYDGKGPVKIVYHGDGSVK